MIVMGLYSGVGMVEGDRRECLVGEVGTMSNRVGISRRLRGEDE